MTERRRDHEVRVAAAAHAREQVDLEVLDEPDRAFLVAEVLVGRAHVAVEDARHPSDDQIADLSAGEGDQQSFELARIHP